MDELAAAAVVVSMATDGFADHEFGQRGTCGTFGTEDAARADVESTPDGKENNMGDAATGDPEDAALKVTNAPQELLRWPYDPPEH